jgi:RND family efflux transporter MFP subunit
MNLDQVWAELAITPKDFPLVRIGQPVELTSESAPGRVYRGTVSASGSTANEKTHTLTVRCVLKNPGATLRPETFVRGHIITDVREERIVVPTDAIQEHDGTPTVYVAQASHPGAFEVRHVKLGVRGENRREIREGLKGTEQVATGGTFYLKSEALKSALSDGCCAVAGE